jgi:hypothetical protein
VLVKELVTKTKLPTHHTRNQKSLVKLIILLLLTAVKPEPQSSATMVFTL